MKDVDIELVQLDKYISELRNLLNEVSITSDEEEARLMISECLDELIVIYMKMLRAKKENSLV
ncbi:hypothetical protein [Clostridium polynesiense]|uniref:hypothetical protein n=1 Tax=Clostridium polynesiense TaxID=1325933 RepID=UPI00058FA5A6|nr:hypothetical protein [Clostridium polynesiense]